MTPGEGRVQETKELLKRSFQPLEMARRTRIGSRRVWGRSTWVQGLAES